jgi:hypothetical protein
MKSYIGVVLVLTLLINSEILICQTYIPYVEYSELEEYYYTDSNMIVVARVYSEGLIDDLCGVGYEFYKDGMLIHDVADYGSIDFRVRQSGDNYHEGSIEFGHGMLELGEGEFIVGAYTLGMFDNYCVNRNRPVQFTMNFREEGEYTAVMRIYTCSNYGGVIGTSFIAVFCDGEEYFDRIAPECQDPEEVSYSTESFQIVKPPQTPYITFSDFEETIYTEQDIEIEARLYSDGLIDDLCGISYEIHKDNEIIDDISQYGSLSYSVRQTGDEYYNGIIESGSGMIEVEIAEYEIGAFTLGIFDNDCVERNRPVNFTANFHEPGIYRMFTRIHSCENTGSGLGTYFNAVNCDGLEYEDRISAVCENPSELYQNSFEFSVELPPVPNLSFTEIEEEYFTEQDIETSLLVWSDGLISDLCAIGYEVYHNDNLVQNINDYGIVNYTVRQTGEEYYHGEITEGSGIIEVEIAEYEIGAFTLGIFDNYCVQRNRPVEISASFNQPGHYRIVSSIYSCENEGTGLGTYFTAIDCDGEEYEDRIAAECINPIELSYELIEFTINTPPSNEAEIISYEINGFAAEINSEEATIILELPYGTDLTELFPEITVSEGAEINPEYTNFTEPRVYSVLAEDGISSKEWTAYISASDIQFHTVNFEVVENMGNGNGTLAAFVNSIEIFSPAIVEDGSDVYFEAYPDIDFVVKEWKINSILVIDNNNEIIIVENLDSDINVSVEFMPSVYLTNVTNGSQITIFPNPNIGSFIIQCENYYENIKYEIINSNGQVVYHNFDNLNKNKFISVSTDLKSGVYFLRLISSKKVDIQKFVVE